MRTPFELFRQAWEAFTIEQAPSGETVVAFADGALFVEKRQSAEEAKDVLVAHAWLRKRELERMTEAERELQSRLQIRAILDEAAVKKAEQRKPRTGHKESAHGKQEAQRAGD